MRIAGLNELQLAFPLLFRYDSSSEREDA